MNLGERAESDWVLGVDVGGSAIKAGLVSVGDGKVLDSSATKAVPPSTRPADIADQVAKIVRSLDWDGPVGVTLPSVVINNIVRSAANIDKSWLGLNAQELFSLHLPGSPAVSIINDADAAGMAEIKFGNPRARSGAAIFLTLGTGIGSAMLVDGVLFPNSELGHLSIDGMEAEHRAAAVQKTRNDWTFEEWAQQLNCVLNEYEKLFSPELFVIGGGISADFDQWEAYLHCKTPVVPAQLRNQAGVIGAALAITQ